MGMVSMADMLQELAAHVNYISNYSGGKLMVKNSSLASLGSNKSRSSNESSSHFLTEAPTDGSSMPTTNPKGLACTGALFGATSPPLRLISVPSADDQVNDLDL